MKLAKTNKFKLITLILALLCFLTASFTFMGANKAFAEENASDYFTSNASTTLALNAEDGLVATLKADGDTLPYVAIKNKLALNNLEIDFKVNNVNKVEVVLTYDSYFENGIQKTTDGSYDKVITDKLVIINGEAQFHGETGASFALAQDANVNVSFKTANNKIQAFVNDVAVLSTTASDYFNIKGKDKNVSSIELRCAIADASTSATLKIANINQDKGNDATNQSLKLNADGKLTPATAPVVSLSDANLVNTLDNNTLTVINSKKTNISLTAYSVLNNFKTSDLYLKAEAVQAKGNVFVPDVDRPTYLTFFKNNDYATDDTLVFSVKNQNGTTAYEEYYVKLVEESANTVAPVYTTEQKLIDAFNAKLQEIVNEKDEDGKNVIKVGDKLEIPSMADLVSDDLTPYSSLKYTIYCITPSKKVEYTDWKITLDEPGTYKFYVAFKDDAITPNEMDEEALYKESETDPNVIITESQYVFKFTVGDTAPFAVSVADQESVGKGYVGVRYQFKPFDINATNYNATYVLYYSADTTATADDMSKWIKVEVGADFTADDYADIDYDKKVTFNPTKAGAYMVECQVVSKNQVKSTNAYATVVITEEPTLVRPSSNWLENNVASVIFLSVGTALLIVLLVLIFVKPKNDEEVTETKQVKKTNDKK